MDRDYVECDECGHAAERHSTSGCDFCSCSERWTVAEIRAARQRAGLPATYNRLNY